jgi:hypothetical protein
VCFYQFAAAQLANHGLSINHPVQKWGLWKLGWPVRIGITDNPELGLFGLKLTYNALSFDVPPWVAIGSSANST